MKTRTLVIALAIIFIFSVAPGIAKSPKANGPTEKPGDVCQYVFGTQNTDGGNLNLCWDKVNAECTMDAEKWSVELYGSVSYAYGTVEPYTWVFNEDYSYDYGTFDRCFSMSLSDIADNIAADLPADLASFSFGTISAKVKGLDPHRDYGKKRQDNPFSDPYEIGSLNWPVPE